MCSNDVKFFLLPVKVNSILVFSFFYFLAFVLKSLMGLLICVVQILNILLTLRLCMIIHRKRPLASKEVWISFGLILFTHLRPFQATFDQIFHLHDALLVVWLHETLGCRWDVWVKLLSTMANFVGPVTSLLRVRLCPTYGCSVILSYICQVLIRIDRHRLPPYRVPGHLWGHILSIIVSKPCSFCLLLRLSPKLKPLSLVLPSWQPIWKKWLSCQWLSFSRLLAHGALNIFFLNPCRVNLSFEFLLQWEFLESLKLDFGLSYLFLCLFYFSFQFYLLRGFFYQCVAIFVFLRDFWDFTLSTFNFLFLSDNVAWEKVAEIAIIFGFLD